MGQATWAGGVHINSPWFCVELKKIQKIVEMKIIWAVYYISAHDCSSAAGKKKCDWKQLNRNIRII
jgi:hypothetical protein